MAAIRVVSKAAAVMACLLVPGRFPVLAARVDDEPQRITLARALDLALANDTALALARAEERIVRGRATTVQGGLLPALEFAGRARNQDGRVQGSFGILRDVEYDTYERGLAAVYRINIGAQIHNLIAARKDVGAVSLQALAAEQRLLLRVTELYQNLLLSRVGFQIATQLVGDSEIFVRIASARVASGLASEAEVARAEAKLAADRQQRVRARHLWESVSLDLAEVLRLDPHGLLVPAESEATPREIVPPDVAAAASDRSQNRPDVVAAGKRESATAQRAHAAWWELLGPDITARWQMLELGDAWDDLADRTDQEVLLVWSLSLDKLGRITESRAEKEAARIALIRSQDKARVEAETVRRQVQAAREEIPLARGGVAAARRNLDISLARYETGTALAQEVMDAEDTLAQGRLDLARAIVSFNLAQAHLLAAAGVIDRDLLVGGGAAASP